MPDETKAAWWFKKFDVEPNPFRHSAFEFLDRIYVGFHHCPLSRNGKFAKAFQYAHCVAWADGYEWATTDMNQLTRGVFLAHDMCLRFSVRPLNFTLIEFTLFDRERGGGFSRNHPTLEDAVETWRKENTDRTRKESPDA